MDTFVSKLIVRRTWLTVGVCALLLASGSVLAHDIEVQDAWSRPTVKGIANGVTYFDIKNAGDTDDSLVSASSPVADRAEIHTSEDEDGVTKMRKLDSLDLPAGETKTLSPRGYHIMLMKLKEPLEADSTFPLTLSFENGEDMTVDVHVRPVSSKDKQADEEHEHHDHHNHDDDHSHH